MIVILGNAEVERLVQALRRARSREIGGVLVGEHVSENCFRLVELSFQMRGGGRSHFNRDPVAGSRFVEEAIARSGKDPTRVNYLGEWHSHPGAPAVPSGIDIGQMQRIVEDPDEPSQFAVLMIASLDGRRLDLSASLFQARQPPAEVSLLMEEAELNAGRNERPGGFA